MFKFLATAVCLVTVTTAITPMKPTPDGYSTTPKNIPKKVVNEIFKLTTPIDDEDNEINNTQALTTQDSGVQPITERVTVARATDPPTTVKPTPPPKVFNIHRIGRYKILSHLTNHVIKMDPRVHDINVTYTAMYGHIYHAFDLLDKELSFITHNGQRVTGVNFVFNYKSLPDMYAPRPIDRVIDFVRPCYLAHSEIGAAMKIAILRSYDSESINKALIRAMSQFYNGKVFAFPQHIFLWASRRELDSFLSGEGYKRVACGGHGGLCDWSRLGVPKAQAIDLCLYKKVTDGDLGQFFSFP